jgi:predicted TIM-barrel fold metal-dependent hydrolase
VLVVDVDVHVHESPGALAPYCDMPWRVALETVQDVPERYLDIPGFSPGGDGTLTARFPTSHEATRTVTTPERMRDELSALHVDIAVLFPDHLLKLAILPQADYAAALARAYNAWLVAEWARPEHGLLGCVVACPQEPEDAAREIERHAHEPGIVGVYLPCAGLDPLWGHRRYDPIYRAAESTGLPVLLHAVTVNHSAFPFNNHGFDTELGRHATSHTFSIMANCVHMITTGVPVRFPELRVAVTEAGVSWMPFLCNRLDKEYLERRREVPFLEERPSHYLKRFYVATQPIEEPEDLGDVVKLVELYDGEDTTVFASDWPHHDFDHPMKVGQIPWPDDVRRKIFGLNALELLGIDAEARRRALTR